MAKTLAIQLMSDLHLEVEDFHPEPLPGADLLVLAGDIDARWVGFEYFRRWPVPVLVVAGNHEFDHRDHELAWPMLRARCDQLGLQLLDKQTLVLPAFPQVRFVGCTRWCDFDLLGEGLRDKAMRAASFYIKAARMTLGGAPVDALMLRELARVDRAWLQAELQRPHPYARTVVITHFAPSAGSADPRYGLQPGTAGFCNRDDDLLPHADLWLHGHLHCPSDYLRGHCRVVANPRGYVHKQETGGYAPDKLIRLDLSPRGA